MVSNSTISLTSHHAWAYRTCFLLLRHRHPLQQIIHDSILGSKWRWWWWWYGTINTHALFAYYLLLCRVLILLSLCDTEISVCFHEEMKVVTREWFMIHKQPNTLYVVISFDGRSAVSGVHDVRTRNSRCHAVLSVSPAETHLVSVMTCSVIT